MQRDARTVSFLAAPDADDYPVAPLMILLVLVAVTEGADAALFPAVTKALEETVTYPDGRVFSGDTLGWLATVQLIIQALAGPTWAILASRGMLTRPAILGIGTLFQGLATAVMWYFITNTPMMLLLRAVNGICLAALRPIANSIVGDRFDDDVRGQYFSYIGSGMQLGNAVTFFFSVSQAKKVYNIGGQEWYGWQFSFIAVGLFTAALSPAVILCMKAPPVQQVAAKDEGQGLGKELNMLVNLFKKKSFAVIVFQGCFGLLPWRAFDFRAFFFETAGLTPEQSGIVGTSGAFGAAGGNIIGGFVGDLLHRCWPNHGRVLAAEISVYGGIPIAYMTFQYVPAADIAFVYYLSLTIGLGLLAAWTEPATINPVLCSLAREDERALILAWQTSLQGAIGAFGPIMFTTLCYYVLGYDAKCARKDPDPEWGCDSRDPDANFKAAGTALFLCSCIPWAICGLLYSTLHYTYPADLEMVAQEAEERLAQGDQAIEVGGVPQTAQPSHPGSSFLNLS